MALPIRVARGVANDPFDRLRDFDRFLNRFFSHDTTEAASFPVDVRETENGLTFEADLPGFGKDEIDITLENGVLSITAERKMENTQENAGDYLLHERRYSRVQRSFNLPPTIAEQSVNAKLENGVLTVALDKREETKPRKIAVN